MNIIHVRGKIPFITNEGLPKTLLPQGAVSLGDPTTRQPGRSNIGINQKR